ncbi:MAG: hypothetical protein HFE36_01995 [Clostridia bacterium]|nr:hypothetical protein [Clostridia bacterium]
MNFEKKLVILSGKTGKGTALIERNGAGVFVTLNAFSLPDLTAGEYALGVKTSASVYRREVGSLGRIKSKFALPEGEYSSVHLVVFRTYDEEVVLYGTADAGKLWEANVMDGLRRERLEKKASVTNEIKSAAATEFEYSERKIADYFLDIDPSQYKDNAISEVNYFEYSARENEPEYHYDERLSPSEMQRRYLSGRFGEVRGAEQREVRTEQSEPRSAAYKPRLEPVAEKRVRDESAAATIEVKSASRYTVEEAVSAVKTGADFYSSVRRDIEKLFSSCEKFEPLERALPDTRWVKVDYDSSGRYYVVGLIGSAPDFIAYGVPGKYGAVPASLKGADFVPLGEEKSGEGFWVLFQSAQTGKEAVKE